MTLTVELKKRTEDLSAECAQLNAEIAQLDQELARLKDKREEGDERLRELARSLYNMVESLRTDLTAALRQGFSKRDLIAALEGLFPIVEEISATISSIRSHLEDNSTLAPIDSYIRAATDLREWMKGLAKEASKKAPLNESHLPPDPGAAAKGQAPGFVTIEEAIRKLSE